MWHNCGIMSFKWQRTVNRHWIYSKPKFCSLNTWEHDSAPERRKLSHDAAATNTHGRTSRKQRGGGEVMLISSGLVPAIRPLTKLHCLRSWLAPSESASQPIRQQLCQQMKRREEMGGERVPVIDVREETGRVLWKTPHPQRTKSGWG